MVGLDEADLVQAIGYDIVEHAPHAWNHQPQRPIIHIDTVPAEIDAAYQPVIDRVDFKQHRADPFLLRFQTDGFSLSLDYLVTAHNAQRITALFADRQAPVLATGGTFFLAKDDTWDAATYARMVGSKRIIRFWALKQKHDPEGLWQSDLFCRLFGRTTTTSSHKARQCLQALPRLYLLAI